MAEETSRTGRYALVLVTGIVSLAVGVGSGLLLDYFRQSPASLTYAISNLETFAGQQSRIGILGVRISNPGRREAEDVRYSVSISGASIREHRVVGIPVSDRTVAATDRTFELATPFLNPGESVTTVLLLALEGDTLERPAIKLRGKGIVGREETTTASEPPSKRREILPLAVSALTALGMALTSILVVFPRLGLTRRHADDQRDVLAYVLGLHGFMDEAQQLRATGRRISYWAAVDELTERLLKTSDKDTLLRGMAALETLLSYAWIATASQWLIRINMARLAAAAGDVDHAKREISAAMVSRHRLVLARIDHDDRLRKLCEELQTSRSKRSG